LEKNSETEISRCRWASSSAVAREAGALVLRVVAGEALALRAAVAAGAARGAADFLELLTAAFFARLELDLAALSLTASRVFRVVFCEEELFRAFGPGFRSSSCSPAFRRAFAMKRPPVDPADSTVSASPAKSAPVENDRGMGTIERFRLFPGVQFPGAWLRWERRDRPSLEE